MTRRESGCRQRGLALVMVILVLVAMALIATPFAVSMRGLESGARQTFASERARAGALAAIAVAKRHLEDTHASLDTLSPVFDGREEISEDALLQRFGDLLPRDPRGTLRSVRIQDEQGKVPLGSASYHLLGNLLGGHGVLTADVGARADVLPLTDTRGFPGAGLAFLEGEQVEFSVVEPRALLEVERGYVTDVSGPVFGTSHPAGTDVFDVRLLRLVQAGWHMDPGRWYVPRHVDDLLALDRFAEVTYDRSDVDRVADLLSVHAGRPRWQDPVTVIAVDRAPSGGARLLVADGSFYGSGTVVRFSGARGERGWNVVLEALPWGDVWRLELLEAPDTWMSTTPIVVQRLVREPVNVCTAEPAVLQALLAGLGPQPVVSVLTEQDAAALAILVVDSGLTPRQLALGGGYASELERAGIGKADLDAAAVVFEQGGLGARDLPTAELAARLVGRATRRASARLGRQTAERLAGTIARGQPRSHEDLRALLDGAVEQGDCSALERDVILLNAVDAGDARIVGGTAPFTYASGGLFTIDAACIENAPTGRERSRAHVREVVSIAPVGESARVLSTQAELVAAGSGRGWTTGPHALLGQRVEASGGEVARATEARAAGADRGSALLAGRSGPQTEGEAAHLTPAPVRSGLADTIHFDEVGSHDVLATPRGRVLAEDPLELAVEDLPGGLTDDRGRLLPFTVEFWLEVDDIDREVVLFDAGVDVLENRVLLMLGGGELVLRVSGGAMSDFESAMPEGRPPPAGEIRYAFDDGLPLVAGVPYHVLAHVGGARDSQLVLLVDGVPRGRRTFTTHLTDALGTELGRSEGTASGFGTHRIRVDDATGFPERGVLRIGQELLEYASRTDDTFVVEAAGSTDTFGGRARRGSSGEAHDVNELVELVGYARPLASDVAGLGDGSLAGRLTPYGFAELDPDALSFEHTYEAVVSGFGFSEVVEITLGTGLEESASEIPVRSPWGASLDGVFQEGGGHAVLFCDYGYDAFVGQNFVPFGYQGFATIPVSTTTGAWIGGAEVVRYDSFDGSRLKGCLRAAAGIPESAIPSQLSPLTEGAGQEWVRGGTDDYDNPKAFVTTIDSSIRSALSELPATTRVFVIPISIAVDDPDLVGGFHPGAGPGSDFYERSFLSQIGIDFPDEGDGTEWVRWTTPTDRFLVRDDAEAVQSVLGLIASEGLWNGDETFVSDWHADAFNELLRFRGQAGTEDGDHETGERVLPVHAFEVADFVLGVPGRHDAVTLLGDDGAREAHLVNHGTNEDLDWPGYGLVAFRDAVTGGFARTSREDLPLDEVDTPAEEQAVERVRRHLGLEGQDSATEVLARRIVDSRRITRLVKAPSGELPDALIESVHLGADHDRRATPGATIDELRVVVPDVPGPILPPFARFRLGEELAFDEDAILRLGVADVYLTHGRLADPLLGEDALEILTSLPQRGGLLLVGEEVIAYAGLDPLKSGAVFLTERGLYGTLRTRHELGEPVTPLVFWPAAPLAASVGVDDDFVPVDDPFAFPDEGLLWIGDELVGYSRVATGGLAMPRVEGRGALRGRFGTRAAEHDAGAMVRWQPRRHADRALFPASLPEAHWLDLRVRAEHARFTELALRVERDDPLVQLVGRVVLDGLAAPGDDPATNASLAVLPEQDQTPGTRALRLDRQADTLDIFLGARWLPGAFDTERFASNAWKIAPRVPVIAIGHEQPPVVLEHTEWR